MKFSLVTLAVASLALAGSSFFVLSSPGSLPARETTAIGQIAARIPEKLAQVRTIDVHALIHAAAAKHKVPEAFVKSIVAAESNFDAAAVSRTGAIGLMQLMPATAQEYSADPKIPEQNIEAGTKYLRCLMTRYQKSRNSLTRVIAAYNAGPTVVDRYRGIPPYRETRRYVVRVLGFMKQFEREHAKVGCVEQFAKNAPAPVMQGGTSDGE
uniref:Lytic transglycosylase, catalytic n=1 Tax=Solibacter usitatus (strain Ellin6076) TaxID=234267 RepID=Q01QM1_SOLUE